MKEDCIWLTVLTVLEFRRSRFDKMFLNILITLFLLGLCLAEQKEPMDSISFLRPNLPLPYKYNPLYDYSIEKSGKYNDQLSDYFRPRTNILKSIQYAPLNPEEKAFPGPQRLNSAINKIHLEPKNIEQSDNKSQGSQENFIQYIEGHNIIVPLKKHKDNGYKHGLFTEKSKEMNDIDDDDSLSKLLQETTEPQKDEVSSKAVTTPSAIDSKNKKNLPKNDNPTKSFLSAIESSNIEPVFNPYVKVPRLHLNIARSYNFAKLPLKASLMGYKINKPKQPFVQDFNFLLKEKTFMYPVKNNHYTIKAF